MRCGQLTETRTSGASAATNLVTTESQTHGVCRTGTSRARANRTHVARRTCAKPTRNGIGCRHDDFIDQVWNRSGPSASVRFLTDQIQAGSSTASGENQMTDEPFCSPNTSRRRRVRRSLANSCSSSSGPRTRLHVLRTAESWRRLRMGSAILELIPSMARELVFGRGAWPSRELAIARAEHERNALEKLASRGYWERRARAARPPSPAPPPPDAQPAPQPAGSGAPPAPATAPATETPAPPAVDIRFDIVVASFRTDGRATSVAEQVSALGVPIRRVRRLAVGHLWGLSRRERRPRTLSSAYTAQASPPRKSWRWLDSHNVISKDIYSALSLRLLAGRLTIDRCPPVVRLDRCRSSFARRCC
jgi:hypothetical protein